MTMKNKMQDVAREMQAMTTRELGTPASYEFCLNLARKFDKDPARPKGTREYAAWLFDKAYP